MYWIIISSAFIGQVCCSGLFNVDIKEDSYEGDHGESINFTCSYEQLDPSYTVSSVIWSVLNTYMNDTDFDEIYEQRRGAPARVFPFCDGVCRHDEPVDSVSGSVTLEVSKASGLHAGDLRCHLQVFPTIFPPYPSDDAEVLIISEEPKPRQSVNGNGYTQSTKLQNGENTLKIEVEEILPPVESFMWSEHDNTDLKEGSLEVTHNPATGLCSQTSQFKTSSSYVKCQLKWNGTTLVLTFGQLPTTTTTTTTTTSTTTTTTATTTAARETTNSGLTTSTTQSSSSTDEFNLIYLLPIILACVIVIAALFGLIFWIRKKRNPSKKQPMYWKNQGRPNPQRDQYSHGHQRDEYYGRNYYPGTGYVNNGYTPQRTHNTHRYNGSRNDQYTGGSRNSGVKSVFDPRMTPANMGNRYHYYYHGRNYHA